MIRNSNILNGFTQKIIYLILIVCLSACGGSSSTTVDSIDKNCSDFTTREQAQAYFDAQGGSNSNNVDGLDGDHDGQACESLPSDNSASTPAPSNNFSAKVISVYDGDTITVQTSTSEYKIRLAEIDCPEKSQAYGDQATLFTINLVLNQTVNLNVQDTDRYGRLIAKISLTNGTNLNQELLKSGFAWWYEQYSDDVSLRDLEKQARDNNLGLWQDNNPTAPWDYRQNN